MKYEVHFSKKLRGYIAIFQIDFLGKELSFRVYAKSRIQSIVMACGLYKDLILLEQKYLIYGTK